MKKLHDAYEGPGYPVEPVQVDKIVLDGRMHTFDTGKPHPRSKDRSYTVRRAVWNIRWNGESRTMITTYGRGWQELEVPSLLAALDASLAEGPA